jgi:hypothetical protein
MTSVLFLGVTLLLLGALVAIAARTYGRPKEEAERPKQRMLEED